MSRNCRFPRVWIVPPYEWHSQCERCTRHRRYRFYRSHRSRIDLCMECAAEEAEHLNLSLPSLEHLKSIDGNWNYGKRRVK